MTNSSLASSVGSSLIQSSGLSAGFNVNQIISELMIVAQQPLQNLQNQEISLQTETSTLSTVDSTVSSFQSSIETLTNGNIATVFDLFANRNATSSNTAVATVTAGSNAAIENLTLKVDHLATPTVASGMNIGATLSSANASTTAVSTLGNQQGTGGTFSFYVKGTQYTISINSTDSLKQVINDINATNTTSTDSTSLNYNLPPSGVTASINSTGQISLTYSGSSTPSDFKLGSSYDTSNFLSLTGLQTADAGTATDSNGNPIANTVNYTTQKPISIINSSTSLVHGGGLAYSSPIYGGTIQIGGATIVIDQYTSLADLMYKINSNSASGALASLDITNNKFILTSKNGGNVPITMQELPNSDGSKNPDGTNHPNILEALGLMTVNSDGSQNSLTSQTLGQNSIVEINGNKVVSASNTLTGSMTGISGLSINLNSVTANAININITQDTGSLTSAVNDFINQYNNTYDQISQNTAAGGSLSSEFTLQMFMDSMRSTATSAVNNPSLSTYNTLASIGISTGDIGTSINTNTDHLQLNQTTFLNALQNNPDEVRALLIGDTTMGVTGILQNLDTLVSGELDPTNGYFATATNSINSQISDLNNQITDQQTQLTAYQQQITTEFTNMNQTISQMKSQSSSLSNL